MNKFKYFSFVLLMMVISIPMVSCSDDDDDFGTQDYFIEVEVSGGGLTAQELISLESQLNAELSDETWNDLEKDEAIYLFNIAIEAMQMEFSEGVDWVEGTLKLTFYLKTDEGKTVKKSTLNITKNECYIN